jgi:RNA polymerase sigma factor (sigma-70 family)
MSSAPKSLQALLDASDPAGTERAWAAFLDEQSELLIRVARSVGGSHDAVMDRYAFILDALRKDDCRRLRAFLPDGQRKFTTWLIVVVRRLCRDEHRHRYGRPQGESPASVERHQARRKLVDLIGDELAVASLPASGSDDPDLGLRREELTAALSGALERLTPSERLLLRLRFEEGLSVPEIARTTSAGSPFPVYRRIDAILRCLRDALHAAGVEDSVP